MRDLDGEIFLIDFGAVKEIVAAEESHASLTIGIGTKGYRPSEQANGKP